MVEKECEYCEKKFNGINDKQVDAQIIIHKVTRHSDRVELKEKK